MKRVAVAVTLVMILSMLVPLVASASDPTAIVAISTGLNLREEPGLDARVLFALRYGEEVTIINGLDDEVYEDGVRWVEVSVTRGTQTRTGWVSYAYLDLYGCASDYIPSFGWRGGVPEPQHSDRPQVERPIPAQPQPDDQHMPPPGPTMGGASDSGSAPSGAPGGRPQPGAGQTGPGTGGQPPSGFDGSQPPMPPDGAPWQTDPDRPPRE